MTSLSAPATQNNPQRLNFQEMTPNQTVARAPMLAGRDVIAQSEAAAKARAL